MGKKTVKSRTLKCYTMRVAQSVYLLATGWNVRGSNSGRARFSEPIPIGPGAYPASFTTGNGSFPGVKWPERGAGHPPHLALRLKEEYD